MAFHASFVSRMLIPLAFVECCTGVLPTTLVGTYCTISQKHGHLLRDCITQRFSLLGYNNFEIRLDIYARKFK